MKLRNRNLIILFFLVISIFLLLFLIFKEKEEYKKISHEEGNASLLIESKKMGENKNTKKSMVKLYFKNKLFEGGVSKVLTPEIREITYIDNYRDFAKTLFEELKKGPKSKNLYPVIPENATLKNVFKDKDTIFLDFSESLIPKNGGGILDELSIVYSIVNTYSENFIDIRKVKILIDGKERNTLLGHIDISGFLKFSQEYVAGNVGKNAIEEENLN